VRVEDRAVITASALDPDLPGRTFLVAGQPPKTHPTARRFALIEVNS
jgi:hypothetical protein